MMPPDPTGQILPDTNFGRVLTRLAMNSNTIVEIGCWRGGGSTKCLAAGLVRPEQRMFAVDTSPQMIAEARERNPDERITFLCGTVLTPEECDPASPKLIGNVERSRLYRNVPHDQQRKIEFFDELKRCETLPYVGDSLPEKIDLLLLDGGEYSSQFDFYKLYKRARVIALDDIRRDLSEKNYRSHQSMMSPITPIAWNLMFHRPYERHGWSVFMRVPKRPNGKLFPLCEKLDDIDRVLTPKCQ